MGLLSKYTSLQIGKLDKKQFMKEANYDDIFTDFGIDLNVMVMCRESTAHEEQQKALGDQVERMKAIIDSHRQFNLVEDGIVIEDGKSGLDMDIRPKFKATIERAVSEDIDIIIVQSNCPGRYSTENTKSSSEALNSFSYTSSTGGSANTVVSAFLYVSSERFSISYLISTLTSVIVLIPR